MLLPMVPASPHLLTGISVANVNQLLASERNLHRRQRELVRASLVLCPQAAA
jgi:hypothetical protein